MKDSTHEGMRSDPTSGGGSAMNLDLIYYILFRHKWCILICFVIGVIAAGVTLFFKRPPFYSEAKLYVKYVVEAKSISSVGAESQFKSPDTQGENIINSQIQILMSRDLIDRVVTLIKPETILAKIGGGNNPQEAALAVQKGLRVDVPGRTTIIRVALEHPDVEVAQRVVERLVDAYLQRYLEIHRSSGQNEFLSAETEKLRGRLKITQEELRKLRGSVGVINLEESQKGFSATITQLRQQLIQAEAEMVERKAMLDRIDPAFSKRNDDVAQQPSPEQAKKISDYRNLLGRLEALRSKERDLLTQLTEQHPQVKGAQNLIVDLERRKVEFETQDPELRKVTVYPVQASTGGERPSFDIFSEKLRVAGLETKVEFLSKQLSNVIGQANNVERAEAGIMEVKRKQESEEANYRSFLAALEQARLDSALRPDRMSDIQIVQRATPPVRRYKELLKLLAMILVGGIGAGVGIAVLREMVFDRTVRRPQELETNLHLPVFLSIPDLETKKSNGFLGRRLVGSANSADRPSGVGANGVLVSTVGTGMLPFNAALRDRVIMYLERMTHKPKLIAVTGSKTGAGVTCIATGLATALSETAEGRVLLVDMNGTPGAVHPLTEGKAACGLAEVLGGVKREDALVQENLYVASVSDEKERKMSVLPRQFAGLVPRLKASDYDYVIFDMPPVNQTSMTPRLAGLMDLVLLVVESEKATRESVQRATNLLLEAKGNVAAVFNKRRNYIPSWLTEEPS